MLNSVDADAQDVAAKQRRVISWLKHPYDEHRVQETTAIRVSQECEKLKDVAAASLEHYGFHCEQTGHSGIVKLQFPPPQQAQASQAATSVYSSQRRTVPHNDPFTEVPTVAIASGYRDRKHVKHSWTQRLVETERRGKLYN